MVSSVQPRGIEALIEEKRAAYSPINDILRMFIVLARCHAFWSACPTVSAVSKPPCLISAGENARFPDMQLAAC